MYSISPGEKGCVINQSINRNMKHDYYNYRTDKSQQQEEHEVLP